MAFKVGNEPKRYTEDGIPLIWNSGDMEDFVNRNYSTSGFGSSAYFGAAFAAGQGYVIIGAPLADYSGTNTGIIMISRMDTWVSSAGIRYSLAKYHRYMLPPSDHSLTNFNYGGGQMAIGCGWAAIGANHGPIGDDRGVYAVMALAGRDVSTGASYGVEFRDINDIQGVTTKGVAYPVAIYNNFVYLTLPADDTTSNFRGYAGSGGDYGGSTILVNLENTSSAPPYRLYPSDAQEGDYFRIPKGAVANGMAIGSKLGGTDTRKLYVFDTLDPESYGYGYDANRHEYKTINLAEHIPAGYRIQRIKVAQGRIAVSAYMNGAAGVQDENRTPPPSEFADFSTPINLSITYQNVEYPPNTGVVLLLDYNGNLIKKIEPPNVTSIDLTDGTWDRWGFHLALGSGKLVVGHKGTAGSSAESAFFVYDLDGNYVAGYNARDSIPIGTIDITYGSIYISQPTAALSSGTITNGGRLLTYTIPEVYTPYDAMDLELGNK